MQKLLLPLLFSIMTLCTDGCGYHPYPIFRIPDIMQTLIVDTTDPYGPLATAVYEELQHHSVRIIDTPTTHTNITSLRLQEETVSRDITATFPNGKTSEYVIMMTIHAEVVIPDQGVYPITSAVSRSFFDHPQAALAKDTEQNIIIDDMRQQAVEDLIRQFAILDGAEKNILYQYDNDH
ncbi:LPS-assembly lipoprotein LptE [Candidatus Erwinia haradaeae]|uniref:LPS-assembly lipoprotein LptE n=1 Tax=Candidatus Erwinia haradaeae TaxID=1922217 RepID=A0A451DCQ4_9GAMM|nr:LPS assembly lipoprotein LptE [Candidatus Erwinia haradaeae]VFP84217.1 LPS-assembly lipoprotein LptE [Candidatus Erwinia haradaeae]